MRVNRRGYGFVNTEAQQKSVAIADDCYAEKSLVECVKPVRIIARQCE